MSDAAIRSAAIIPPGAPAPNVYSPIASVTLFAGQLVASDPNVDDAVILASADDITTSNVLGIVLAGRSAGARVPVRYAGPVVLSELEWNGIIDGGSPGGLVRNTWYYASQVTPGNLRTTPPGSGVTVPIGFALSPTTMFLQVEAASAGPPVITLLGTPVVTSRQWTTGLAPRNGGGWNFIMQSYEYPTADPTEWIVVHLETGAYTDDQLTASAYANSNFQIPSANSIINTNNQLRAPNGRIFFLERGDDTKAQTAYYEPADSHVHQLPEIDLGVGTEVEISYNAAYDHAGAYLYVGTQSNGQLPPALFRIDPVTLVAEVLANVGSADPGFPRYAYHVVADAGPGADYVYVTVGEHGWQLISVQISTKTATVLYTTSGPGFQFMDIGGSPLGCGGTIYDNGVPTSYWVADGALADGTLPVPPGGARNTVPYTNPLVAPPEIDWTRGVGQVLWRPNGSSAPFTEVDYSVVYKSPIPIESLIALPSQHAFGNAQQYNGFFDDLTWYGAWPAGLSQPTLVVVGSKVYMAGYPDGTLYVYDPALPWAPNGTITGNPSLLGNFHASDMKYAYFLEESAGGVLYCAGRKERDAVGPTIGTYDIAGATFGVVNTDDLTDYGGPAGFLVMDGISRVVLSCARPPMVMTPAQLIIYDLGLVELSRHTIDASLTNTGALYATADPHILLGITGQYVYQFNVFTGALVGTLVDLGTTIGASAQRPSDGSVWMMVGTTLTRIDPLTLATTVEDTVAGVTGLAWSTGSKLYLAKTAALYVRQ